MFWILLAREPSIKKRFNSHPLGSPCCPIGRNLDGVPLLTPVLNPNPNPNPSPNLVTDVKELDSDVDGRVTKEELEKYLYKVEVKDRAGYKACHHLL